MSEIISFLDQFAIQILIKVESDWPLWISLYEQLRRQVNKVYRLFEPASLLNHRIHEPVCRISLT